MRRWARFALAVTCASVACAAPYAADDDARDVDRTEPRGRPDGGQAVDASQGVLPELGGDAAPEARPARCDRKKPFGEPVFIDSINSADHDADARLTPDEKTLYFTSERGTVGASKRHRVWAATRVGSKLEFAGLTLVGDFADAALHDPTVSPDGLTLVVQHSATPAAAHLRVATRDASSGKLGPFVAVAELDMPSATERDPYFAADGTLLFTRDGKIARAVRKADGWEAALAPELADLVDVRNPVLSADGREIFFSSEAATPGKQRILRAERASTTGKLGPAAEVTELGGTLKYEAPTWLSADGCLLLLSSDRAGGLDVYYALRGK